MEKRKQEKKSSNEDEDYGDYVTRCICDFKHDDGYMICCDGCSVWQHVECMQVDPKNLPEKYLCELCEPRPVDRQRARQIQIRKQEDLSELEDNDSGSRRGSHSAPKERKSSVSSSSHSNLPSGAKKRKKKAKPEPKVELSKKGKKDRPDLNSSSNSVKKPKKKSTTKTQHGSQRVGSIQSLLTAASILEGDAMDISNSGNEGKDYHSLWNANASPWTDKYETANHNRYSEPVKQFVSGRLSQLKSEAVVYSHREYTTTDTRTHPQAALDEVGHKRKGLIAKATIPEDELVLEYKGKVTVKQAVLSDLVSGGKSLWKHKPCPFVYLYDKISDLDLCIDARSYGNLARFMRRSCSPNSELRHFFVSNELHFGVYALNNISIGEEITIPFDFRYEKCDYVVECACGQGRSSCLVAKSNQTILNRKQGRVQHEEKHHSGRTFRQRSHSHVVVDEDSNSSWTSTGSGRKRSRRVLQSPIKQQSRQDSRDVSSDSEEEGADSEKRRKSLSREERKTEQVWKLVEKMEASAQRRRQHLLSEGSGESDQLTSPSGLHSLKTIKERRSSGNSVKKVQLMPGGKMRLSSVSSADPLSPCDFSEAFSPPITPGLGPTADAGTHPRSPMLSPDPLKPSFEVTPHLHPKYLFADFALPWKKAILKQWESEQQQIKHGTNNKHPYWTNGHALSICHMTSEHTRPRVRGCLKHRWLKKHSEQQKQAEAATNGITNGSSDKENNTEDSKPNPLPYKKQVLLRWQTATESASSEPAVPDTKSEEVESNKNREVKREEVESGRGSPLFEDFSDSEDFEVDQKKGSVSNIAELGRDTDDKEMPESSAGEVEPTHREGPKTPPPPPSEDSTTGEVPSEKPMVIDDGDENDLSSISDVSLASNDNNPVDREGPKTPPLETAPFKESEVHISDISSDMDTSGSMDDEPVPIVSGKMEPVSSFETSSSVIGSELRTRDVDVKMRKEQGEEAGQPLRSGDGSSVSAEMMSSQLGVGDEPAHGGGEAEMAGKKMEDMSSKPHSTPGKRKINLSEYRNRARKPADRKERSSPPHTTITSSITSTPSFLSHTVSHPLLSSTSSYSSSLGLGTVGAMQPASSVRPVSTSGPQFEPVSPDDNEQSAPNLEDSSSGLIQGDLVSQHQQLSGVSFINRPMVVNSMSVYPQQQPVGLLDQPGMRGGPPGYHHQAQQAVPMQVVAPGGGQYIMHDARWNTMAVEQDPRRVGLPQDHPSSGILPIPAHGMVQQPQPAPGQYVQHGGPILQSPLIQQDMGQMMMRGEFHQPAPPHAYGAPHQPQQSQPPQHRPPAGGPVYRPRHSGPGGGTYY